MLTIQNAHDFCIVTLAYALHGVKDIFVLRFARVTPPERRRRWKRTLLLVPLLAGLFFVAVAGSGDPAIGKATKAAAILAALNDPLSLFAERSPGGRGAGALLSTKPDKRLLLPTPGRRNACSPRCATAIRTLAACRP